jgi:hypothetical protein
VNKTRVRELGLTAGSGFAGMQRLTLSPLGTVIRKPHLHQEKNPDDPCRFRLNKMKISLPIFMLTADEPATVQKYGHENGAPVFI